jgi:hypothetical protein
MTTLPRLLNPLAMPLTRRLPPLAVLHHQGRRTGRSYAIPVQAYRTPNGWVVALAYDHNAPFALNLLAAGGGDDASRTSVSNNPATTDWTRSS